MVSIDVYTPPVIPAQAGIQERSKKGYLPLINARKRSHDGVFVFSACYAPLALAFWIPAFAGMTGSVKYLLFLAKTSIVSTVFGFTPARE